MSNPPLAIIDLASFTNVSLESTNEVQQEIAKQLVDSLHTSGFAYIKNHGLSKSEVQGAFTWSKKFFDLPLDDKMRAPHPPGWAVHRGYSWPGLEKVSNATATSGNGDDALVNLLRKSQDFKESYEVGSENFTDMPNIWPPEEIIPGWQAFMQEFYWKCFRVCTHILQALAMGLELDSDQVLTEPNSGLNGQLRLLHYPPIPADELQAGTTARMPTHSDWSTMTILFQDDCGGLQVEKPDQPGEFIDVTPIEDTLVMNVGDLLMRWSNDYLKSTQHRVTLPQLQDRYTGDEQLTRARYSIPFFLAPDPDVVVRCLDLGKGYGPRYEPITQREYAAMRARMQYQ